MKDTENNAKADALAEAVKLVQAAIRDEEARLEKIAHEGEQSPIMLEGTTSTGYYAQIMVNPREAAQVLLDYQYPVWKVLEEDAPIGMWDRLADIYGLDTVSSVDL